MNGHWLRLHNKKPQTELPFAQCHLCWVILFCTNQSAATHLMICRNVDLRVGIQLSRQPVQLLQSSPRFLAIFLTLFCMNVARQLLSNLIRCHLCLLMPPTKLWLVKSFSNQLKWPSINTRLELFECWTNRRCGQYVKRSGTRLWIINSCLKQISLVLLSTKGILIKSKLHCYIKPEVTEYICCLVI